VIHSDPEGSFLLCDISVKNKTLYIKTTTLAQIVLKKRKTSLIRICRIKEVISLGKMA